MPLQYDVQNQDGTKDTLSTQDLVQQLQGQGVNIAGISADGSTLKMQDQKGSFDVKAEDVLKQHGWQVNGIKPDEQSVSYDHVNPEWRAATQLLPHDDHKRAYLEGQFRRAGIDNPQITGSGRDWYAFDPESNKYVALTNHPGMANLGMADLAEVGVKAPGFIGQALGGLLGGASGAGTAGTTSIPLAMAGAAGGGALADTATRAGMAMFDPELAKVMKEHLGSQIADVGVQSGLGGLAAGIPGAGKAISPALGKLAETGIVSSLLKGGGRVAESAGKVLGGGAKMLDNGLGRDAVSMMIPGAAEATGVGALAQLPGQAIRGAARGVGSLGETSFMKGLSPEAAQAMKNYSTKILSPSKAPADLGGKLTQGAEEVASRLRGNAPGMGKLTGSSEDILANVGESLGQKIDKVRTAKDYGMARDYGIGAQEAKGIADEGINASSDQDKLREWGRTAGRGIQHVENLGKAVEDVGTGIAGAGLKTARGVGYVGGKAGQAARLAGTIAQPLENRALAEYGSEEHYAPQLEKLKSYFEQKLPLQEKKKRANILQDKSATDI